ATIFEHAPHGIVYMDLDQRVASSNPAADRLLGTTITKVDSTLVGLYRPDGSPMADRDLPTRRAMRGESVDDQELLVETADGTKRPMLVSATPVVGPSGAVDAVVTAFEDISVLKELDLLRAEFAAIVAHDLRNPISSILLSAETMLANGGARGKEVVL